MPDANNNTQDQVQDAQDQIQDQSTDQTTDNNDGLRLSGDDALQYIKELREENKKRRLRERELEEKLNAQQRKEQEERGEFKQLYDATKTENETLKLQIAELNTFRESIVAQQEEQRKALLKELPDEVRSTFAEASVEQLKVLRDRLAKQARDSQGADDQTAKNAGKTDDSQPDSNVLFNRPFSVLKQLENNKG